MKQTRKIGTNRGQARIWIEGKALVAAGWTRGTRFNIAFEDNCIVLTRDENGSRKVAGKDQTPIIDTNTDKIRQSLGDVEKADIDITETKIIIRPDHFRRE